MIILKDFIHFIKKIFLSNNLIVPSILNINGYNSNNKTIVFLSNNIPTPDRDSGSNRLKEIILLYKELGYNCILCTKDAYKTDEYLNYFSSLGVITFLYTKEFDNYFTFLKTIPKIDYIWYNGPNSLKRNIEKIQLLFPNSKSIFDMVDINFLRYERALKLKPNSISFRKKHTKYFNIETNLAKKADYIIAISDVEKEIMSQYIDTSKIFTISNIHYPKINKKETLSFEDRKDLLFIGSTHTPNVDALYYLYNEIMPLVWAKLPEVKVNIIGNVNVEISDINHPNITFLGYVPDIEPLFKSNKMMIAPLRYGAGVKGKIGQAFEYYLPVITSSIGAEGMNLIHNENLLVEDTKEGFANAITNLYTDKILWQKLQNNSENSLEPFSREKVKSVISKL